MTGASPPIPSAIRKDALAVIQYTGGTTGSPKGAMLTHANLTRGLRAISGDDARQTETAALEEGKERMLCVLPLFHIYALSVVLMLGLRLGAEIVLHPRFDPAAAAKDIVLKKITVYAGVPTMHVAILNLPGVEIDGSFVAQALSRRAARRCRCAVQQDFEKLVGCRLTRGLGHDRNVADRHVHARALGR